MRKTFLIVLFLALFLSSLFCENLSTAYESSPWLQDFHQLIGEMSAHYANLEFAVNERKMDLPALRQETEAKLRDAKDEREAQRIFQRFLDNFGDGHLEIDWKQPLASSAPPKPEDTCGKLGYNARLKPGLNFSAISTFTPLEAAAGRFFPGGLLRLPSGEIIGILRIGLFSEHAFPALCHEAIAKLRLSEKSNCDDACENQIELYVANSLTAALAERATGLRSAGAEALLVDITHNGGGSDWVEAASRTLSSVPLRDSRLGFVKHPHWTENLRAELADLEADHKTHPEAQVSLNEGIEKIKAAIEATTEHCDTTAVWETGKLTCTMLAKDKLFVSGLLDYAKPGSFAGFESKTTLFQPLRYNYSEDSKRLPLYVLVDRDTWSSAEYFAAILQDNHAATIVGESTGGAGCGYTNDGIPVTLKNSGAAVRMPDCVRFRADGSNEVNGITPDLMVPWPREASDYQRAMNLIPVLDKAITAANSK